MSRHELELTLARIADEVTLPEPTPTPSHRKSPKPRAKKGARK